MSCAVVQHRVPVPVQRRGICQVSDNVSEIIDAERAADRLNERRQAITGKECVRGVRASESDHLAGVVNRGNIGKSLVQAWNRNDVIEPDWAGGCGSREK